MRNASRPGLPGLVIGEKNMTVTALEGSYKLKYYDYNTFQIDEIMKDTFYPDDWMDTRVPEDVRTALKRYGYIDGYYYGKDLDRKDGSKKRIGYIITPFMWKRNGKRKKIPFALKALIP